MADVTEAKAALRRALRDRRAARDEAARAAAGERLAAHAAAIPAGTVAAFVGTRTEPPTLPLLDALRPAHLGLLEPVGASLGLGAVAAADLVLAPALAVDVGGRRLGQGGGSYDRALERAGAPVVAIVFDDELRDEPIPVEPHDKRVAGVLTPGGGLRWLG